MMIEDFYPKRAELKFIAVSQIARHILYEIYRVEFVDNSKNLLLDATTTL